MTLEDNLPDIALANVALENLNEKGENKIKSVMSSITDELNKNVTDNYNTLNDKITNDITSLDEKVSTQITNLSTATDNNLKTKAGVDLSNLTDSGNTVIDNRITAIMNSVLRMPNYDMGISISFPFTIPSNGWILAEIKAYNTQHGIRLTYRTPSGNLIMMGNGEFYKGSYSNSQSILFPVEKNGIVDVQSSAITASFYPFKY